MYVQGPLYYLQSIYNYPALQPNVLFMSYDFKKRNVVRADGGCERMSVCEERFGLMFTLRQVHNCFLSC